MTPVFSHGSLRLYLLSLLDEAPRHGYELIQALTERFGGTYSPSAGTIYPRLAKLEEEGLVTKATEGRKTVYQITDAGRAELEARRPELDAIEEEVTDSVRRLADEVRAGVNDAMRTLRAELASAAREAKRNGSRVDPRQEARDAGRDARAAGNAAAREAEAALNDFRQQLRTDLRYQAARGALPADIVPLLKDELDRVRRVLVEAIGRR
ncbi:DNA-binding transcriptional regulator, PadR family [Leifsonia sp. 98AMF]|uniref:PadR family transcriptional regulator n=1 Tax=Microbacteriaceae TaxID=85023 RepID=UPI000379E008|nr:MULTISPECIES: PadR family transcriptional regulator [Microbacteriaceae]TDP98761.1 PadR family transcriptional regulator [Leifsonia sp. 115AMFTsu3.1]SDH67018.1 DNA-binding transcriptional regulator, PadR family [Leifsonia sp. 197AMF]SDI72638.1 DNA-binding transcriptional regulator, PadR family [Leifsonia sp. 466MF]SDK16358.1 DNA-binding transcriptional regulator, PadR family [Leifsonia sp. 157MF]SDN75528.1 DNA-binding transcriptional regulator, PadR family [Leifsonia sp. 509MF]